MTMQMEEPMAEAGTQVFRVSLNPKLYRDIEIPTSKKLYDLASAIVAAFGFDFDHAFGFYSLLKGNILRSPSNTSCSRTWPTWTSRATPVASSGRAPPRPSWRSATR